MFFPAMQLPSLDRMVVCVVLCNQASSVCGDYPKRATMMSKCVMRGVSGASVLRRAPAVSASRGMATERQCKWCFCLDMCFSHASILSHMQ